MIESVHSDRSVCQENGTKTTRRRQIPAAKRSLNTAQTVAIRMLSRFSMLTVGQLATVMGRGRRTAERALAGLSESQLVCCGGVLKDGYTIHIQTKPEKVYSLNADGVTFVEQNECSMAAFNRKPIARSWNDKMIQDKQIKHKLGIVDCMIALCRSVATFKHLDIAYLAPDFINNDESTSINQEKYKGGVLIPDVIAVVINKLTGTDRTFYIEYDRGFEPVWLSVDARNKPKKRGGKPIIPLSERFANYDKLLDQDGAKTSDVNPAILWVCEHDEALRRIRDCERIMWGKLENINKRTKLATIDAIKDDFLGACWHLPDSDEIAPIAPAGSLEKIT